jgi:chromosome partitioning protein
MILAVVHQKGGVGKTTLALHLAAAFSLHGQRCLLIDADPQHSALDWSATRQTEPLFAVVGMPRAVLYRDVPGLSCGYDMVVIDGPPRVVDTLRSALAVSEVALIPVQPSPLDVWSCAPMVELVKEA